MTNAKGLLSVSFGTSYAETRAKTIDVVDADLAAAFPERAFYSAWTSSFIVKKVRKRGEHHDTLDEAFARMSADGVDDVVIATMCLMEGHEMEKARDAARAWVYEKEGRTASVAAPLLSSETGRRTMAQALCDEFAFVGQDDALVFMGHGSQDSPADIDGKPHDANAVYAQMQDAMRELGRPRFIMATVEGRPTFDDALAQLEEFGVKRVHLAPFMIVAGDHAQNDLAGEDEDSWKNLLEARGYEVEVTLKGLGEYAAVQRLVCDNARAARDAE